MLFDKRKKDILSKIDKSKKSSIDKDIKKLIDLINSKKNYYTTSSCSGRILLISIPKNYQKNKVEWHFVSHKKANLKQIKDALKKIKTKKDVWLRQESMILHIASRTLKDAQKLRDLASNLGFKRSGIIASRKNIIMELIATENMDTIVMKNGKILVNDDYLKIIIKEANKKLARTKKKIKVLYKKLKEL